jgi:hypothetical protein
MLARVREASLPVSEDICNDLAHLNLIQGRITEAEHLYLSNIKNVTQRQRRTPRGFISSTYVFCYTIVLPSFLVLMSFSISPLSIDCPLFALSDTT